MAADRERDEARELPPGIVRSRPASPSHSHPPSPPLSQAKEGETGGAAGGGGRITAIEAQQKREGRVSVYVDGKFAIGLFVDVAAALGLKVGQTITEERLAEAARDETLRRALEDAYTLLSYRDRAEKELADRLARKGYEEDVVAATVAKLQAAGYVDDASFARRWVNSRGGSRGRRLLAQELRQKGVGREVAAEALADSQADDAQRSAARLAAVRRVGERPADTSREARARLTAYLQRRGFDWDVVRPVLAELYGARPDEDDPSEDGDEA